MHLGDEHLLGYENGEVRFRHRDHARGNKTKVSPAAKSSGGRSSDRIGPFRCERTQVRCACISCGLDRVRKQAIGHHYLAIGYRARIGHGIERAAEAVIRHEKN